MNICKKLKDRRKELGLTMLEVAQKIGVSEATVSRWESGDIANMRRDKIVALANALKVSPSFIMGTDEETDKNNPAENDESNISVYKVAAMGGFADSKTVVDKNQDDKLIKLLEAARDLPPEKIEKLIKMTEII